MSGAEVMQTVGGAVQILGLVVAAGGLYRTWRDNTKPGDRFRDLLGGQALDLWIAALQHRPLRFVWCTLLRRPMPSRRPVTGTLHSSFKVGSMTFGTVTNSLDPAAPIEDQIRQVKTEVDEALAAATKAQATADRALSGVDAAKQHADEAVRAAQDQLAEGSRRTTLDGVPVAVVGLALTVLGTIFQLAAPLFGTT